MVSITRTPRVVRANGDDRRHMTTYGWFSFNRTGAFVPYKGELTLDFLTVAASSPDVTAISKEVDIIQLYDGRKWREHIPRYSVHLRREPQGPVSRLMVDVEWSWVAARLADRTKRLLIECGEENIAYAIYTETDVRVQPRLGNALLLGRHAALDGIGRHLVEDVDGFADKSGSTSIDDIVAARVAPYDDAYRAVLHLVANGRLHFPIARQPFGRTTRLYRSRAHV